MRILLITYDNGSYIHNFPHSIGYIASVLKKAGHEVIIYDQDMGHYPEKHLTRCLEVFDIQMVGVSVIAGYYQYKKLMSISKAINASKYRNKFKYIIGGHGPAPEPKYFLEKTQADVAVIGEGENTILEIVEAIKNKESFKTIKGTACIEDNVFHQAERRELIKDIDTISRPAYALFNMNYYRLLRLPTAEKNEFCIELLSGRGCPFHCTFCYRLDEGFRPRSPENIIEEMKWLNTNYHITCFYFYDELLMSSVRRTEEICEAFLESNLKFKWLCNGRYNFAKPSLLKLMKKAGCSFINYGVEAMDDNVLRNMKKNLTVKQILAGTQATIDAGISPGLNLMWGNIGDYGVTLNKAVDFLLEYDDHAQMRTIRPVTPYPGSELYYYAIKKGLLKDVADFYENKHLNSDLVSVNFTNMTTKDMHKELAMANKILLERYYKDSFKRMSKQIDDLYIEGDVNFRGFRQV